MFKMNSVVEMKVTGKMLYKICKAKGWSIAKLAKVCGYSKGHMWKMMNGWEPITRQVELTLLINKLI